MAVEPTAQQGERSPARLTTPLLAEALLSALRGAGFDQLYDFGPLAEAGCPEKPFCAGMEGPIRHLPNIDLAVIAFQDGAAPACANVLLSRDFPAGRAVEIDPVTMNSTGIRWRKWDMARWDGGIYDPASGRLVERRGWYDTPPLAAEADLVPGQKGDNFYVPYPASAFKLLVGVRTMQVIEEGLTGLDGRLPYQGRVRTVHDWLEDALTSSSNIATFALIKQLHDLGRIAQFNSSFADLGLSTLQLHHTDPATGSFFAAAGCGPGHIHMTAWDSARLLWLLDPDAPIPSWQAPGGKPVDPDFLTVESKRYLLGLLAQQGFHEALSGTALCGKEGVARGIPARVPEKWIAPDGSVTLHYDGDDYPLTGNVHPCNERAEVIFAHKTGITANYGSDIGIVRGIPGKARRHYVITFFSNLGNRYSDEAKKDARGRDGTSLPCYELGIFYPQVIPSMAGAIDRFLKQYLE